MKNNKSQWLGGFPVEFSNIYGKTSTFGFIAVSIVITKTILWLHNN